MRLVHTADWHLGHRLGPFERTFEHEAFLSWLMDQLERLQPDALIVAGDIFDRGNPPAEAQHQYFRFLATCRARFQTLTMVVIGGNHDLAPRLDAPSPLLDALQVHVLGAAHPTRSIVPVWRGGACVGVIAAIPFLRASDLVNEDATALIARTANTAQHQYPGVPLVMTAHAHLHGAHTSLDSERPLFSGVWPASIFPNAAAYVALGHIHLAQRMGSDHIRYAGSPLPLSIAERHYRHSISVVDVGVGSAQVELVEVPRAVDFLRVPEGDAPLDAVLDAVASLKIDDRPWHERPFLDVRVHLESPVPDLRARVEAALGNTPARLVRVQGTVRDHIAVPLPQADALDAIEPLGVLRHMHEAQFGSPLPPTLEAAFLALLEREAAGLVES